MTPLSFDTWIELGLKGTAVLGLAAATCCAMRRSSAASRHLVWASAISAVLALPALSLLVPSVPLPLGGVERLTDRGLERNGVRSRAASPHAR